MKSLYTDITRYLSAHPNRSNVDNLRALKAMLSGAADQMATDLQKSVLA
jgi:hypothetical protein